MEAKVLGGVLAASLALVAAASAQASWADPASCANLKGFIVPSHMIDLPTKGAVVDAAEWTPAKGRDPDFCKVTGEIKAIDPAAPEIRFEVNLPAAWNTRMLQLGGGGLDGTVVTGLGPLDTDPPDVPTPLARGYATFGGDSGHHYPGGVNPLSPDYRGPNPSAFSANRESLINFASASVKKTHDAALTLATLYYGRRPAKTFFFGASEGGREGMIAVQMFPKDYDAVTSRVPILSWTGTILDQYHLWRALMGGGWLSPRKVALVQGASASACDEKDGLKDGVAARYLGCDASGPTRALRCPGGADTGEDCLSDAQLSYVGVIRSPFHYAVPLARGEADYPAWPTGGEAAQGGYIPFMVPPVKPAPDDMGRSFISVGIARAFIVQNEDFKEDLDESVYKARIQEISSLMDMNNPDLSTYAAHGGKLLILDNGGDYTVAPGGVYRYYRNVVAKAGKAKAEQFVRLYVAPGLVHFGAGVRADGSPLPNKVDVLTVMEDWALKGAAPPDHLLLTSFTPGGAKVSAWPMCRYGDYPHYDGKGDPKESSSFSCKALPVRH